MSENISSDLLKQISQQFGLVTCDIKCDTTSSKNDNFIGVLKKLHITGKDEKGNSFSSDLIYKRAPTDEKIRAKFYCEKCFNREIYMYTIVLPTLTKLEENHNIIDKFKFPKLYTSSKEKSKEYLLLEDLTKFGYEMRDRRKIPKIEDCKALMGYLANLHALSFVLKKKDPPLFEKISDISENVICHEFLDYYMKERIEKVANRAIACFDSDKEKDIIEKIREFLRNFDKHAKFCVNGENTNGYKVFCHGDTWINNIFIKTESQKNSGNPSICLIDWQLSKIASPIIDIVYFIYGATDKKFREENLAAIFEEYYTKLSNRLQEFGEKIEDHFPKEEFQRHIKLYSKYGLVISVLFLHLFLNNEEEKVDSDNIANVNSSNLEDLLLQKVRSDGNYRKRFHDVMAEMCENNYI